MGLAVAGMTGGSRKGGVAGMVEGSAEKLNFNLASMGKGRAMRGGEAGGRQGLSSERRQRIQGKRARDGEERAEARAVTKPEKAGRDGARPRGLGGGKAGKGDLLPHPSPLQALHLPPHGRQEQRDEVGQTPGSPTVPRR